MFALQYELSACFYLVMKIQGFLTFCYFILIKQHKGHLTGYPFDPACIIQGTAFRRHVKVHFDPNQNDKKVYMLELHLGCS